MAELQFPAVAETGETHTSENGVTYTYDKTNDSWTASGGGGGNFVPLGSWSAIPEVPVN